MGKKASDIRCSVWLSPEALNSEEEQILLDGMCSGLACTLRSLSDLQQWWGVNITKRHIETKKRKRRQSCYSFEVSPGNSACFQTYALQEMKQFLYAFSLGILYERRREQKKKK